MSKTIELPNVKATAVHFSSPFGNEKGRYIVLAEDMDFLDFLKKYRQDDAEAKQAQGINLDGTEENFFLVYVADCFDPPVWIVRAEHAQAAEEWFVNETTVALIEDPDLADYDEESLHYNDQGKPYDSEGIQVYEVRMVAVELP